MKRKVYFRRLMAAALAGVLVLTSGCSGKAPAGPVLAEAVYPEMAPYPNEEEYFGNLTEMDPDQPSFEEVYDAWRADHDARRNQPEGYAAGLDAFFEQSIPVFLDSEGANPVCSPLNLYMALAVLAETTQGVSRQQILDALGSGSLEHLREQAGHVWNAHYCDDDATATILANSLWLTEGIAYEEGTIRTLAEHYYASVFQGPLGTEVMNQAFRQWLNDQTGGLLEEQTQGASMDPQTVLALASTIYYQAKWATEFREERNTQAPFQTPGGEKTVTYLNRTLSHGPYYWGQDFGAVSLSLENGSRMWLFLPDEGKTPADLLASGHALALALSDSNAYENQKSLMVNLSMPKFDISADTRMEDALGQLGITQVFQPDAADFTAIVPQGGVWLDKVQHAARVQVDEEGVSAAAYTVMMMAGAAMPPNEEMDFVLDRPFLFVISSRDNLPLFAGVVNTP